MSETSEPIVAPTIESVVTPPVDGPVDEPVGEPVDLDAIERDLDDVQAALARLDDGTYFVDEVTGEPIPDDVLAARPTARSATGAP